MFFRRGIRSGFWSIETFISFWFISYFLRTPIFKAGHKHPKNTREVPFQATWRVRKGKDIFCTLYTRQLMVMSCLHSSVGGTQLSHPSSIFLRCCSVAPPLQYAVIWPRKLEAIIEHWLYSIAYTYAKWASKFGKLSAGCMDRRKGVHWPLSWGNLSGVGGDCCLVVLTMTFIQCC